jgi:hypothetical protein
MPNDGLSPEYHQYSNGEQLAVLVAPQVKALLDGMMREQTEAFKTGFWDSMSNYFWDE